MSDDRWGDASAFWIFGPGQGALRSEPIAAPDEDEVLVETLASGVSSGTENLVFQGFVPPLTPSICLPEVDRISACPRPPVRHFSLGDDMLFECCFDP